MKSPPAVTDDCDDIFGPPRTYATGYTPPKQRLSMISAKYRQKEERRKVLKISINKLKKIEDPEASLCRSVLINNTMKRLQKEARDEKLAKQQLNYPRCYDNDNFLNLKSEFIKNEMKTTNGHGHHHHNHNLHNHQNHHHQQNGGYDETTQEKIIESFEMSEEAKNLAVLNGIVEENLKNLDTFQDNAVSHNNNNNNNDDEDCEVNNALRQDNGDKSCRESGEAVISVNGVTEEENGYQHRSSRDGNNGGNKRSYDEMDDCDVQEVLSQFYMPPTPRMLTCIDDDEDVNLNVNVNVNLNLSTRSEDCANDEDKRNQNHEHQDHLQQQNLLPHSAATVAAIHDDDQQPPVKRARTEVTAPLEVAQMNCSDSNFVVVNQEVALNTNDNSSNGNHIIKSNNSVVCDSGSSVVDAFISQRMMLVEHQQMSMMAMSMAMTMDSGNKKEDYGSVVKSCFMHNNNNINNINNNLADVESRYISRYGNTQTAECGVANMSQVVMTGIPSSPVTSSNGCGGGVASDNTAYSCGHASIFSDLQSNVFHSLIASLET